ncbi:MAG: Arc family DNA-binding protein [Candidatus Schekmanbacteria bacterium]|nr:Arc family DNA-binding protein [Candidatus Schekmanbacteria bacterium]
MPGLLIKNLPDEIHRRLKNRALENRRSLSAEVIVILEDALCHRGGRPRWSRSTPCDSVRRSRSRRRFLTWLGSADANDCRRHEPRGLPAHRRRAHRSGSRGLGA